MAEKRYYWIQLKDEFFQQKEIKKLRKIAGGDTYTVIYLKMLLLAVKQDNTLFFEGVEDSFSEELALELDEDSENVKVTLSFLERQGLIKILSKDEFYLLQGPQMVGSESESTARVRRHRARKALQCNSDVTPMLQNGNTDIEIEKDTEIDIELEKEKELKIDYQLIVDIYNNTCVSFPKVTKLSEKRRKAIRARFNTGYTFDDFKTLFNKAEQSNFLKGKNNHNWSATFDWLIKDANMAKVLDGNYDDRNPRNPSDTGNDILLNMIERGAFNE